jgi:hypothetical protein
MLARLKDESTFVSRMLEIRIFYLRNQPCYVSQVCILSFLDLGITTIVAKRQRRMVMDAANTDPYGRRGSSRLCLRTSLGIGYLSFRSSYSNRIYYKLHSQTITRIVKSSNIPILTTLHNASTIQRGPVNDPRTPLLCRQKF